MPIHEDGHRHTDSGGGGSGSEPAPHGRVCGRTSSALAALSVLLILLYLIWRFIWQYRKHGTSSRSTGATAPAPPTSSARTLPCPSPGDTMAANEEGEAARRTPRPTTTTSPLSVRVAAARFGAEKADCAVCLAELGDDEAATRLVPGCGHGFHAECIEAWFRVKKTCPLCRAAVAAADAEQGIGEVPHCDSSV